MLFGLLTYVDIYIIFVHFGADGGCHISAVLGRTFKFSLAETRSTGILAVETSPRSEMW